MDGSALFRNLASDRDSDRTSGSLGGVGSSTIDVVSSTINRHCVIYNRRQDQTHRSQKMGGEVAVSLQR